MRKLFILLVLVICNTCFSQPSQSVSKTDTVRELYIQIIDTIPVKYLYGKRKIQYGQGFVIVKGFKMFTAQGIKKEWFTKPEIVSVIDTRKRIVKNVIQLL